MITAEKPAAPSNPLNYHQILEEEKSSNLKHLMEDQSFEVPAAEKSLAPLEKLTVREEKIEGK